ELDPTAIDRNANIPQNVVDGLARHGVLGMTAPKEFSGRGFSQRAYCKILEEIGARCASTSVFTNAHHSIGIRALLLFGTREQKEKWLPPLVSGEQLAAFALTEREAGSDAANVQTTATPSADGSHYVLNGEKRYITNASIAQVLTVMARTVLDFGRTTFGACCTGAAKTCLRLAVEHANTRRQFKKTLGDFDLVKKKIGRMAADVYAMEAMTVVTASLIDRGLEDYMLETAMLKV